MVCPSVDRSWDDRSAKVVDSRWRRPALIAGLVSMVVGGLALNVVLRGVSAAELTSKPPSADTGGRVPDVGSVNRSLGGLSSAADSPGLGSTSLFGLSAHGHKFVYVFDRSGSMGGSGRKALAAAKSELVRSLESLDSVQQFQVIFYNEHPVLFNPTGQPGMLAFATEGNKQRARRFIESITADGGTGHEEALQLAIRLRPDVIFFLTDAGDPTIEPEQLEQIHRWAAGITIHVIEFGQGSKPGRDNFLMRLARENDGKHTYVDILAPPSAR